MSRLRIKYWVLRAGKPYRKCATKKDAQHAIDRLLEKNRQLKRRAYTIKTVVTFRAQNL